tara:strand:- start:881 stop:1063 length:183 start_codon:yes stop_codon:yes gene_type:complete
MLTTKITYELAEWIREWIKIKGESPTLEDCIKLVDYKTGNYTLTDIDKINVETILMYETN